MMQGYLKDHGCPVAFYPDKHSVFRVVRPCFHGSVQRTLYRAAGQDAGPPPKSTDATPRLNDILCHREQRYVGAQLTFHYDPQADHPGAD